MTLSFFLILWLSLYFWLSVLTRCFHLRISSLSYLEVYWTYYMFILIFSINLEKFEPCFLCLYFLLSSFSFLLLELLSQICWCTYWCHTIFSVPLFIFLPFTSCSSYCVIFKIYFQVTDSSVTSNLLSSPSNDSVILFVVLFWLLLFTIYLLIDNL